MGTFETCARGVQCCRRELCSLRAQAIGRARRTAPLDRASERKPRGRQHARRMDDPRNKRGSANMEPLGSDVQSAKRKPVVGRAPSPLELSGHDIDSGVPLRTTRQQRGTRRSQIVEPGFRTLGLREFHQRGFAGLDQVARSIVLFASGTETPRSGRLDESDCRRVIGLRPRRRCAPER